MPVRQNVTGPGQAAILIQSCSSSFVPLRTRILGTIAMTPLYLDHNATTPLDPGVREEMLRYLEPEYANPSSLHRLGRRARAALDDFRHRCAALWKCRPSEVVFTSGGTESNNLALLGAARRLKSRGTHLVASTIEHHAVLHTLDYLARAEEFTITLVSPSRKGIVCPEAVAESLRADTVLVSIMAANNEIGTLQPVEQIGRLCRDRGIVVHTDAVQYFGKRPFEDIHQFNADLVSVCSHKFYGPKGVGALFVASPLALEPQVLGGPQEFDRRAGTENLAAIAGLTVAAERFWQPAVFAEPVLRPLLDRLADHAQRIPGVALLGDRARSLPNTASFTVDGCDSLSLVAGLDLEGVCVSSGAACSSGALTPSHVLLALGYSRDQANSFVRFSLGRDSSEDAVSQALVALERVVNNIRATRPIRSEPS
jgi:cysteine desulfurase